jgi:exodeoxyribonuclease V beta subunit
VNTATPLDVFGCTLTGTTLIEASAGTGKTWNICALYLRLLLERALPVQQILVVTFTKAATAELRDRIRARIVDALAVLRSGAGGDDPFVRVLLAAARRRGLADPQIEQRLELARATFDEAAIFTIHGFCQRALADVPFAAQMPLALELLENDADLRREVVNDFWRRHFGAASLSEELAACLLVGKDTPETMGRLLARRLAKPLSVLRWPPDIESPKALDTQRLRASHAAAREHWRARKNRILQSLTDALGALKANSYNPASLKSAATEWEQLLFPEDPLPVLQLKLDKLELLASAKLEKSTKAGCVTPRDPFFALAQALLDARAAVSATAAANRLALLKALLEEGVDAVRQRKLEQRVVAFDDMLFNLHQRLVDGTTPWLARTLRERFPAALIDEFQDTDPLQFAIFERIYVGHGVPLFFVGDPKQAIYSFRNADLHTYLDARKLTTAQHTLSHNQRSSEPLIIALNMLFKANPRAFLLPGLDYHSVQAGTKPRSVFVDRTEPRSALQVWTLPTQDGKGLKKEAALDAASNACAAEIARLLRGASEGTVTLDGRPLRAGDIAVLVRTHRQGNLMREALRALRIGSVELSQASVFHTSDAEELERLLMAVLEPSRERALRAALATEILGRDAGEIAALSEDDQASIALMVRFAQYRDHWLRQGIVSMLRQLVSDERVSERLLARPDGERRMTNLLHLAERLQDASTEHRSPQALLRWLRRMREDDRGEEAAQLRLDSDQNLVQIVTVHKAKGLEYPLVFCPYVWDVSTLTERGDGVEYHDDENRPMIDFRPEAREDPAIKRRIRVERCAEELRLIYVALTRAVHRCCIVAGCQGDKHVTTSARSMLNWLVAGQGMSPEAWFEHKLGAEGIARAWSDLAAAAPSQIAVADLPRQTGTPIEPPRPAPEDIRAQDPPAQIPAGWRIGSFSGMILGAAERRAVDHDADVRTPGTIETAGSDDILGFPRGMDAGTCLHAMLERCDFGDRETWLPAARAALALHPQTIAGADSKGRLERMALSMIEDVVRTTLPTGFALQEVQRARRLNELEFHLPSRSLGAAQLTRAMERFGYPAPAVGFGKLEGYLNGFIDLVFEHDGRYYLLDWKSNHLGTSAAAYGPAPLRAAMTEHGYHLQYLLYCIALDRFLALRLPDYDRARYFGGVLYLFVRGVRPGWQVDGHAAGVFFDNPASAVIDALSALLQQEGAVPA